MKVIAVIAVLVLIGWVDCLAQKGNGVKKLNPNLLDTPKKIAIHISIGGIKQPNPIIIGLFTKETPKTTENFLKICEGKFRSNYTGQQMHYSATNFHRIIPKFMMQGGDFTNGDGTGGESIYGYKFADENFNVKFVKNVIAMANAGPNTNGSQFFITFSDTYFLDGKHVVFGRVMDGQKTVDLVEKIGRSSGKPKKAVKFEKCEIL